MNLKVKISFHMQDKYRLEHLKQVLETDNVDPATKLMPKLEEAWCSFHNLSPSSLHQASELCMYLCCNYVKVYFFEFF